jgi:hypothetical protein
VFSPSNSGLEDFNTLSNHIELKLNLLTNVKKYLQSLGKSEEEQTQILLMLDLNVESIDNDLIKLTNLI